MEKKNIAICRLKSDLSLKSCYRAGTVVRRIAEFLGRSPNTVAREIKKNAVKRIYTAEKGKQKASARRWRVKEQCLKAALKSRPDFLPLMTSGPNRAVPRTLDGDFNGMASFPPPRHLRPLDVFFETLVEWLKKNPDAFGPTTADSSTDVYDLN